MLSSQAAYRRVSFNIHRHFDCKRKQSQHTVLGNSCYQLSCLCVTQDLLVPEARYLDCSRGAEMVDCPRAISNNCRGIESSAARPLVRVPLPVAEKFPRGVAGAGWRRPFQLSIR